ncbi:MAG: hypothetical protein M0P14_04995 [Alkaliphilus sp.]|nr:hypothetical protein [Alkaliphilus sp.]
MKRELKKPRQIRIDPVIDRKIQRIAEYANTTYIASLEYLADAGYRYYISQNPDAAPRAGRIPRLENLPKLK